MKDEFNYPAALSLNGCNFVVLGSGGGGIGTATCLALAQAGASLLCVDRDLIQATEIAEQTNGTAYTADITSRTEMTALFKHASLIFDGKIDGVVDIVGVAQSGSITSFDDEALASQMDIVLRHAILAIQIGGSLLAQTGGSITFVGSISGMSSMPGQAMYGVAKAALHHLVRCAAHEYGPSGVRVNAVAPGLVETPRLKAALPKQTWQNIATNNPLRRTATPTDVAKAILFLASDLASYVTGNVLTLDGGICHNVVLPGLDIPLGRT